MSRHKMFGTRPIEVISVVEPPVSQWYARRARVTFLTAGVTTAVMAGVALSAFISPVLAIASALLLGVLCGAFAGSVVLAWPVLRALWWWLPETILTGLVFVGPSLVSRATHWLVGLGLIAVVVAFCGLVRPVRRFIAAWSWCVVDRHRLRLCFARIVRGSAPTGSRPGSLPLMLWARPTPAGERVWVWLRPGLELEDLDGKTGQLAVAMPAKQVRVVSASERYAALIRVDISRRDPLAGRIDSPLALLIPSLRTNTKAAPVAPVPPVGLDLADIEEPAPERRRSRP
ncbi:hypothetical protein AB0M20_10495 [Actinoplanes sp. NPDC051633]|uniref:hypothetical protein n=1 Tax=Actinoplanes sp. NPDC051633 TaxID=3155670 RepID=UPI003445F370